jgi:hypothetical protein
LRITTWSNAERTQLAEQVRAGVPVDLVFDERFSQKKWRKSGPRLDEIVPLCATITVEGQDMRAEISAHAAPPSVAGHLETVTVVIPCSRHPPLGLGALLAQDMVTKVLVLSNGDGPTHVEGATVVRVDWKGHGTVRAQALDMVDSDYVFFTVDDAIPLGQGCIRTLVEALRQGPWDAAVARQIPWPDADAITASRLRRWTPAGTEVVAMSQTDHVATLYKTTTLAEYPIPSVSIAEDAWWSIDRRVAYVPTAPVLHSHVRAPGALFRRNRDIHAQLISMGQSAAIPHFGAAMAALPGVIRPALGCGIGELFNQVAEIAGQWRGAVNAR